MSAQNIKYKHICYLLCCVFFFACQKEDTIEVAWEKLNSGTETNLRGVHFTDALNGHVVGGNTWYSGSYIYTRDGGQNWSVDSISNKQLFGLHFNEQGLGNTVGIDGYLFSTSAGSSDPAWNFHRMPRWDILRDVCFNNKNEGVLVGGIAFDEGAIMVVDSNYLVPYKDTFPNQLNAVCYSDDQTIHVAGYGLILRSTDGGQSWIESEVSGDFFQAISFPSHTTGYMVGYNGTILKTTDNGLNWKHQRRGDAITVADKPFLGLHFINEQNGYIVGENGLCWLTSNGGENWQVIKGLPKVDFHDVYMLEEEVYIVGDEGTIVRIER